MRRTVVTGIGVVAPGGVDRESFWDEITAGRTATRRIGYFEPSKFRSQIAAQCNFDPARAGLATDEVERMDRYVQYALAAALEAVRDGNLAVEQLDRDRLGVSMGTAVGGTTWLEDDYV